MKKIYLAISQNKDVVIAALEGKYKDLRIVEINEISALEPILYEDYYLLISDKSFIEDINTIDQERLKGQIWHIENELKVERIDKGPITLFKEVSTLTNFVYIKDLQNKKYSISHNSSKDSEKEKPLDSKESLKVQQPDLKTEIGSESDNEKKRVKNGNTKQSTTATSPKGKEISRNEDQDILTDPKENELPDDEENLSKPVNLKEPYPELDGSVIEKIEGECLSSVVEEFIKEDSKFQSTTSKDSDIDIDIRFDNRRNMRINFFNAPDSSPDSNNYTIGLWSPLGRIGVTTFAINFSIHLAKSGYSVAVIEGCTTKPNLKNSLNRFTSKPQEWKSYIQGLMDKTGQSSQKAYWKYKGVQWLPIGHEDTSNEWDESIVADYLNDVKSGHQIVLVDLPAGEMGESSLNILDHVDELWIFVDGANQETKSWKKYIQTTLNKYSFDKNLIYNIYYEFSKVSELSKELEIPIMVKIPELSKEVYRNYNQRKPLIEYEEPSLKLKESYDFLSKKNSRRNESTTQK
ncbi:hypothetical protein ACFFIX_20395 [Metabacillus herbersteinensis]|uniref:CobQ/CobB/MinD/ParA nucleotide binding domain-containing protein n=1 Tax=Metabacillus herbersteinensis TaxID=283816 RepID=A0ABV6GJ87_9BACI